MQSKNILIVLSTICALVLIPSIGLGDTITWVGTVGGGDGVNWHESDNWDPPQVPAAGDLVVISGDCKSVIIVTLQSFGGSTDGVCERLDIDCTTLLIKGVKLTLGDADTPTTSTVDLGFIKFRSVGSNQAVLSVHDWVTFEGTGQLNAHKENPQSPNEGLISRAGDLTDGIGIRLRDTIDMIGSLDVWCSLDHQGGYVGVQSSKDTMRLGQAYVDPFDPELVISGDTLNAETITADRGVVEFHQIQFASTAPKWLMKGGNESDTGTMLLTDQRNAAPNDIKLEEWSLLNMREDFDCTGTLLFEKTCTVKVAAGKVATFD